MAFRPGGKEWQEILYEDFKWRQHALTAPVETLTLEQFRYRCRVRDYNPPKISEEDWKALFGDRGEAPAK